MSDTDAPLCPCCDEEAQDISHALAPDQESCGTSWCPVTTWDSSKGCPEDKTKQEVYEDRNALAIALAAAVPVSGYYYTKDETNWPVVWVHPTQGQASWHVPPDMDEILFESGLVLHEPKGGYDGHDRVEKNKRLLLWAMGDDGS